MAATPAGVIHRRSLHPALCAHASPSSSTWKQQQFRTAAFLAHQIMACDATRGQTQRICMASYLLPFHHAISQACNCRQAVPLAELKEDTLGRVASSRQVSSHTPGMLLRWQTVRPLSAERPARGHGLRLLQPWHTSRVSLLRFFTKVGSDMGLPCSLPCIASMQLLPQCPRQHLLRVTQTHIPAPFCDDLKWHRRLPISCHREQLPRADWGCMSPHLRMSLEWAIPA